jgi:hypothetical protein
MKRLVAIVLAFGLIGAVGCEQKSGTAPSGDPNKPKKLTVTVAKDHTITQGETDEVLVNVNRDNFKDPVTLEVSDLPTGVMVETKDLTIPADKNNLTVRLKAEPTAAPVKDHVFHIVGKSGGDLKSEAANVRLTVKEKK